MPVTVALESSSVHIDFSEIGDPLSRLRAGGLGVHGINGIGNLPGREGIGDRPGGPPGLSGERSGGDVTPPQVIYKVEPEFSEEARKAKFQGIVVLAIEVDATGKARGFRIVQPLGLGLDEKAVEAVAKWRFRPGMRNGKPIVTNATVEVTFHLL